ncbi:MULTISPECIES: type I secretion system permease/ATPase [unclassified Klebsiella]|uniref:type I secretion system permease/ATPase n=1 Tax=unclassified Klebsiella TaxID=2608929 RepID=UPI0015DC9971|nr:MULTISPECIES: type I secretion system permease/ATPase [unclassified Klebsiella]BBQ83034.1 transporter HasD [Klebsiella sp. WP3-W18-ESBL-02]BBR20068.1 transporter HasD [Klebsiella sp. WP3-S18-ESBL-05]
MPRQYKSTELKNALKGTRPAFIVLLFFGSVINMLMLAPAIYMLQVYDRVLASQNTTTLFMLTLLIIGLYCVIGMIEFARSSVMTRLGNRLDVKLNQLVFNATFKRKIATGDNNPAQALNDLAQIRQVLAGNSLFALLDIPWTPFYLLVAFLVHPILGYLSLAGIIILFFLTLLTELSTKNPIQQANMLSVNNSSRLNKQLQNADAIEAMGMLASLKQHWLEGHSKVMILQTYIADRSAVYSSLSRFVRVLLQSISLGVGALLVIAGEITPGLMIAASIILGRVLSPVEQVISSWKQFVQFRSAWKQLTALLRDYPAPPEKMNLPTPKGTISVEGVFAAPPGQKIATLRNISFQLEQGEVLGIIGPSASGKSSLAKLMVGVWQTLSGKVRIDGADICQWDKILLGPSIGYLPQDVELFEGTIAENIARFSHTDSPPIVAAAMLAGVHDMILRLPQGYDTPLGANGYQLSGGQRQRIGLARAVFNNPAFIVLDEPNANLDDAGEMALIKAIIALREHGQTVALISHRPTLLGVVNKVLLINEGTMQAFGPREQVFANLRQANILKSVSATEAATADNPVVQTLNDAPREALS